MKPRRVSPWVRGSVRARTGISNLNWKGFLQSKGGRICAKTRLQAACKPVGLDDRGLGTFSENSGHK